MARKTIVPGQMDIDELLEGITDLLLRELGVPGYVKTVVDGSADITYVHDIVVKCEHYLSNTMPGISYQLHVGLMQGKGKFHMYFFSIQEDGHYSYKENKDTYVEYLTNCIKKVINKEFKSVPKSDLVDTLYGQSKDNKND